MSDQVYAGTPITWLPDWLALGWRALLWLAMVYLIVRLAFRAARGDTPLLAWGRAALMFFMIQELVIDAERFHDPLTYEGVPIITIAVFCTWRAVIASGARAVGRS